VWLEQVVQAAQPLLDVEGRQKPSQARISISKDHASGRLDAGQEEAKLHGKQPKGVGRRGQEQTQGRRSRGHLGGIWDTTGAKRKGPQSELKF
jgi:hypothetical protein